MSSGPSFQRASSSFPRALHCPQGERLLMSPCAFSLRWGTCVTCAIPGSGCDTVWGLDGFCFTSRTASDSTWYCTVSLVQMRLQTRVFGKGSAGAFYWVSAGMFEPTLLATELTPRLRVPLRFWAHLGPNGCIQPASLGGPQTPSTLCFHSSQRAITFCFHGYQKIPQQ